MEQPADRDEGLLRYAVGVRELRNNLSRFLAEVKEGKSVVVLDHGHPIGIIKPWPHHDPLEELIRQGRARRPATYTRRRHEPDVEFPGTDEEFDELVRGSS
ncbi:MAG TPA: type II toxin-antitoxin system prevent-host-death family antitoxin [Candidatus Dormibacteraeota bacterium]|nr:type II toxin-antitoxin system prevent-host-death family antitoxin [Candidatus Dormibacteraeota bacterium]